MMWKGDKKIPINQHFMDNKSWKKKKLNDWAYVGVKKWW